MDDCVCVCVCPDYLVLSIGQPAASQSNWIEAGSRTGVAALKQQEETNHTYSQFSDTFLICWRVTAPQTNKASKITALSQEFEKKKKKSRLG